MFTIEVKKKEKDQDFVFDDLLKDADVFHESCFGGRVKAAWYRVIYRPGGSKWYFYCKRCETKVKIGFGFWLWNKKEKAKKVMVKIIQTAIDGEARQLSGDVRVIQKTET